MATKHQLFQFNGSLYEQIDGVAMGSPLGPLLANTFMCSIEEKLESEDKLPSFYKRYMDDVLAAVKDISTATTFLATLNEAHPAISFTMEVANNNKIIIFHRNGAHKDWETVGNMCLQENDK